jgi:hypothetical protein
MKGVAAVAAVALLALTPGAAGAASSQQKANAKQALTEVEQLQHGNGVKTGHELTPALNQLYAQLPALSGDDRARAEAMFARPSDPAPDPGGTHKWSGPEAPTSPKCTAHFCVHFTLSGSDGSNATYAQAMADLMENQVFPCENGTDATACAGGPGLGWRLPASDGTLGGDGRTDIYIEDLFTSQRVFGYVALDAGQTTAPSVPHYGYMVMDKNYDRFATSTLTADQALEVTAAHEYNHVLQNAYDYLQDPWMFEATAVYMEDKVYPSVNDYVNYVRPWVANTRQPLTTFSDANLKPYGSAVWNHWLDHRVGAGVVRMAWEDSLASGDFAPGAYGAALAALGAGGFADEFSRFSAAVAEWEAPGAGFPDRYPDVPRDGTLPSGGTTVPFSLAHTTFAFFDVPIPAGAPPAIRLTGTLPTGTAGALALVGRTGLDPTAGTVTTSLTQMPIGGTAVARLDNPSQFGRITAVVVNADTSRSGFDPTAGDWVFTKDADGVTLSLTEPGLPIVVTGAPVAIADHSATLGAGVDPHLLDTTWWIEYGRTSGYGSRTAPQALSGTTPASASVRATLAKLTANTIYHFRVVATNSAGQGQGADAIFKTAPDVTKPAVTLKVARQRLGSRLAYRLRCSERCTGTIKLTARRRLIGKAKVAQPARSRLKTLKLRLRRKVTGSLAHPLSATLELRVADAAGNAVKLRRRVRLT